MNVASPQPVLHPAANVETCKVHQYEREGPERPVHTRYWCPGPRLVEKIDLARAEGIEPPSVDLETTVLPLDDARTVPIGTTSVLALQGFREATRNSVTNEVLQDLAFPLPGCFLGHPAFHRDAQAFARDDTVTQRPVGESNPFRLLDREVAIQSRHRALNQLFEELFLRIQGHVQL